MNSELFAHDAVSGAQPSTVAAVTPGIVAIADSSRSMNAGAAAVAIPHFRWTDRERDDVARVDTERLASQSRERRQHQTSAGEQHERERDFDGDREPAQRMPRCPARRASPLHSDAAWWRAGPRRGERGRESTQERGTSSVTPAANASSIGSMRGRTNSPTLP